MQITEVIRTLTGLERQVVSVMLYLEKEDPLEGDTYDLPKQTGEYARLTTLEGQLQFDRNDQWSVQSATGMVRFQSNDVIDIKKSKLGVDTTIHIRW